MQDILGLEHSTDNAEALTKFDGALEKYLGSHAETMPAIEDILEADPDLPMAILFRSYLLKLGADPRFTPAIEKCASLLRDRHDLNEREAMHRGALESWQQNRLDDAASRFDTIVEKYPYDMLALRVAHYLHFYGEGAGAMVKSLQPALQTWQSQDSYYGYLKGMECFALEEHGEYEAAQSAGREALEINPADIWATHAVTHIMQMQSRFDEAIPFIESYKPQWQDINNFANHLHWHQALQYIGAGNLDAALTIYDELLVDPIRDDFYLDVCNSASLLWRLAMLGIDVGNRWQELHEISRRRVEDDELIFSTLHYLMAPAILNDTETVERGISKIENWARRNGTQAEVCREVGKPLADAIGLIGSGSEQEGATLMASVQPRIYRIGGSHAQRHLFDQIIEHYR